MSTEGERVRSCRGDEEGISQVDIGPMSRFGNPEETVTFESVSHRVLYSHGA